MEAPENDTTDQILKLLEEYGSFFPKSSNFIVEVNDTNNHQTVHTIQGMYLDHVRIAPPRITIKVRGVFNIYWKRFSETGLKLVSERRSIKGDARTMLHEAEYIVGLHDAFLEDFKRIFEWQKYSAEFDQLIEEELSKKPE